MAIYKQEPRRSKICAMAPSPGSPLTTGIEQEIVDLYEREASGILRYAGVLADNREMAHDAVQEAFFRFFLCRSAGQHIRSPKGWLFRVARNYILDQKIGMRSASSRCATCLARRASRKPMAASLSCCKACSPAGRTA